MVIASIAELGKLASTWLFPSNTAPLVMVSVGCQGALVTLVVYHLIS